jgi:hypothetical protein
MSVLPALGLEDGKKIAALIDRYNMVGRPDSTAAIKKYLA